VHFPELYTIFHIHDMWDHHFYKKNCSKSVLYKTCRYPSFSPIYIEHFFFIVDFTILDICIHQCTYLYSIVSIIISSITSRIKHVLMHLYNSYLFFQHIIKNHYKYISFGARLALYIFQILDSDVYINLCYNIFQLKSKKIGSITLLEFYILACCITVLICVPTFVVSF
jgi:hypothetical protein